MFLIYQSSISHPCQMAKDLNALMIMRKEKVAVKKFDVNKLFELANTALAVEIVLVIARKDTSAVQM